ncbi:MAG: hypothetical protein AAGG01_09060, partial [Planctomycetota bacterium]
KDLEKRLSANELAQLCCWAAATFGADGNGEQREYFLSFARKLAKSKASADAERARATAAARRSQWAVRSATDSAESGFPELGSTSYGGNASSALYLEYTDAKAAYEAGLARYEPEKKYANQRAGRLGALGISVNPTPPDPALHRRYLAAKRAYENSSR